MGTALQLLEEGLLPVASKLLLCLWFPKVRITQAMQA